jgi:type 1 glutamine amidotransferase
MANRRTKLLVVIWNLVLISSLALAQIPPEDLQKIEKAIPAKATAQPKQPRKLLVFTRAEGYKHSSIPYAAKALELMGKQTGAFTIVQSEDMSVFAPENLRQFDAVLFASTSALAFDDLSLRQSLMEFVKSGKGVVGIHAATDNFYNWTEAADMMGGHFEGHPWQANGTWAVKIVDPTHPLTAAFHSKDFQISDEIYRIRQRSLRQNCRVLVALDMTDKTNRAAEGVRFGDRDLPITWVRNFGNGRVFYSSFGHNHSVYWNPAILQHYLDGIQFALGDLPVDTTPLPFEVESAFASDELDQLFEKVAAYAYGQSREPLVNLTEYLRLAAVSPKLQQHNEKRLLRLLTNNASLAGKQFVCEQLSLIGSKASVPALAEMLQDSATSDMTRFALERIPDPAVDKALRQALSQRAGKTRVGIINTIGQRRDTKSVSDLSKLVDDANPPVVSAAIIALGKIGGEKATQALAAAKDKTSGVLNASACEAYLNCADMLLQQGEKDKAMAIYSH